MEECKVKGIVEMKRNRKKDKGSCYRMLVKRRGRERKEGRKGVREGGKERGS